MELLSRTIGRLAAWARESPARARLAVRLLPDFPVTMRLPVLGRFRLRLRRHRSLWLRHPFFHEGLPINALTRLLDPGAVVYDVGANIGVYARWIVQRDPKSKVIAFEPMTENLRDLRANLEFSADHGKRVYIVEYAIGDRDAEELLQVDDQMSASARLDRINRGVAAAGRQKAGLPPRTESVRVRKLDTIVHELQLPAPDVIKIDIEGAELFALEGATDLLKRCAPDLVIEIHEEADLTSIIELLDAIGYAMYSWRRDPTRYERLRPGRKWSLDDLALMHIIASKDERRIREPIDGAYRTA